MRVERGDAVKHSYETSVFFLLQDLKFEDDTLLRSCGTDEVESWRDDLQWRLKQESDFLAQLRARRQRSGTSSQTTSDNEQDG